MTECVIYARLSFDRHGDMLGIERQLTDCRELIASRGWTIAKVYEDNDLSATSGVTRPGFEAMLSEVHPPMVVVCWHIDRLVRRTRDLERVIDLGLEVHAAKAGQFDLSTPAGRAVAKTVTAWAEYEGEQKAERQRAAHRQRVSQGKGWWNFRPIGYRMDGTLDRIEAPLIQQAYTDVLAGASLSGIVASWNARGFPTIHGNRWRVSSLRKVLLAPRNAGILTYQGVEQGPADWQAMVDEETYRAVVRTLTADGRLVPGPRLGMGGRASLLTGFATCSECGRTVRSKNRASRRMYLCAQGCASAWADWVDERAGALIVERFSRPDVIESLVEPQADTRDLLAEMERLRLRGRRYAAMLDDEEIDFDQFGELQASNRAKIAVIRGQLDQAGAQGALRPLLEVDDLQRHWDTQLDLHRKHAVIAAFYEAIKIRPRGRSGRGMRSGDVEFWPKGLGRPLV